MRLCKINIRRRDTSRFLAPKMNKTDNSTNQRNGSGTPNSKDDTGEFWFIEGDLDVDEAKAMVRRMEVEGFTGQHFHGKGAERLYKKKTNKKQVRVKNLKKYKHEAAAASEKTVAATTKAVHSSPSSFYKQESQPTYSTSGRSYGLLDSDEEDEDMMDENEELTEVIPPMLTSNGVHGIDSSASSKNSLPTSPEIQESTQTTQSTTRDASPSPDVRGNEELSPIMPGSFVFDEEAPTSPSYSSGHPEPQSMLSAYLHRTPTKPGYVNPGIAIETRYNAESPLPPSSKRTDLSPYHFAYYLRKKQEMDRHAERSMTPSLMSDAFDEDWGYSEREKAERERRRRDLARFRQEKQRRLIEERGTLSEASSTKRSRDASEEEEENVERSAKKSKASTLFESILKEKDEEVSRSRSVSYGLFDAKSSDGMGSDTDKESSTTPKASFIAPTPSPSPSPPPTPSQPPGSIAHAPKVSSSLRNVTSQSSPATSPRKPEAPSFEQADVELADANSATSETAFARPIAAVETTAITTTTATATATATTTQPNITLSVQDIVNQISDDKLLSIHFPPIDPPRWANWDPAILAAVDAILG